MENVKCQGNLRVRTYSTLFTTGEDDEGNESNRSNKQRI